jgi:large subunit ribosomal protein L25
MAKQVLEVSERTRLKTSGSRKLRMEKIIPGTAYGPDFGPVNIETGRDEFLIMIQKVTTTTSVELRIKKVNGESATKRAYLKQIQRHKVTDTPIHFDFFIPSEGHVMRIEVPVDYINTPKGIAEGGRLDTFYETIEVEALPKDIPEKIVVDISGLALGDFLKVKDIAMPQGVKSLLDLEEILLSVTMPKEEALEETVEEEGVTQPEVIKEKKEEKKEEK